MDKYTVDLDQVLNDFEYSELTDQHLKNVTESSQPHIPFQSPSVTKHSINNVFHSLNEYLNLDLNSSITSRIHTVETSDTPKNKNPDVEDNKLEFSINDKQTVDTDKHGVSGKSEPGLNTNHKLTEFCEKNHPDVNSKEKTVDFDNKYVSEDECLSPMKNSVINTVDSPKTDTNTEEALDTTLDPVNNDSECDRNVNFKSDSLLEQNDYNFSNKDRSREAFDSVEDAEAEENCDKHEELVEEVNVDKEGVLVDISDCQEYNTHADLVTKTHNLLDVAPENFRQSAVLTEQITEAAEEECEERVVEVDSQDEMQEEKLDQKVQEIESGETSLETTLPDQNKNVISNKQLPIKDESTNNDVTIESSEIATNANELDETDPQAVKVSQQKVIGFSADIDIDENELNKMLEDLELEEKNVLESIEESISAERGEINAKEEVTHKDIEEPDNEKIHVTEAEIAAAAEGSSFSPQILECLAIQPNQKAQQSVSDPPENKITEIPSTVKEEREETFLRQDQPEESISRPQDLPLNNQLNDETGGRKINLIGSPGSTPYNNVYINKSIDSKTTHHIESDYTSSASPTFSDCSTDSTSTASTVSIEELPNNEDKFTSKSAGLKNTNLEGQNFKPKVENVGRILEERDSPIQGSIDSDEISEQTVTQAACLENSQGASSVEIINESRVNEASGQTSETFLDKSWLGKQAPLWIPDADAAACLHCDMKFTVIKRRHHCRACGLVLCSKCCNVRCRLEYLDSEARVCNKCYTILNKNGANNAGSDNLSSDSGNSPAFRPNPNNPLEYCSTVSPLQQAGQTGTSPPSVMVPVGVLKRKGSSKKSNKSVMFCDGIAPGSDLTNLDQDFNYNPEAKTNKSSVRPKEVIKETEPMQSVAVTPKITKNMPKIDESTGCFIPKSETSLPPIMSLNRTGLMPEISALNMNMTISFPDMVYSDCSNSPEVVEMLKKEPLTFALNQNLLVHVKIVNMSCCINKHAWCFSSEGLINVGCDEVVYLIEYIDEESYVKKDVFFHVYNIYSEAEKGTSIKELGISLHNTANFLDSKNHAGFVYIKPTFQCLENVIIPQESYLIGILIHRWETPWAKLFPLRLILRLGAEYRYYPSPLISSRHRDSVYVEIGHTIINLLADFRNFTYSLPQIRGLIIHMEDKKTTITIPRNRYDMIMKSISNSSDHILAFAGNFSREADSHLVCIQDTQGHENCYTTHAINIHNKPRKITGASFIVFNGSLKSSSGLTAKSNIVEDGLMIQIPSEHMDKIRDDLRNMKDHTIACGCINAASDESVNIVWGENDCDFNAGVKSPIDLKDLKGIPSIRVHNGQDYPSSGGMTLIKWTEVFILKNVEDNPRNQDPVDISKVSESIAKACCTALVKYIDLLISNNCQKVGIRATLHVDQVSYLAGSGGFKLAPIYMRSLDNELIPVLHRISSNNLGDNSIVLELVFRILNA